MSGNRRRGRKRGHRDEPERHGRFERLVMLIIGLLFVVAFYIAFSRMRPGAEASTVAQLFDEAAVSTGAGASREFACLNPRVTDGDTLRCGDRRVRLAGIDAPEMPGHCRTGRTCVDGDPFASRAALGHLIAAGPVRCDDKGTDRYGRTIGSCSNGAANLSCALVRSGHAVVRYGGYPC